MRIAIRSAVAALVLAAAASPAAAQTEQLKFTNSGSTTWSGYYVGPYQAQVMSEPGSPTIDIYCVDYQHHVSNGQVWNATFTNVMASDLSNTRAGAQYGTAAARTMYQQAAYLTTMYATNPSNLAAINSAIWNIFYTGAPDKSGSGASSSSYWLTEAANNYATAGLDYGTFAVVTDVDFRQGGVQEFLTGNITATPEPSTYILMASGLAGLAGLGYRRRRSQQG